MANNRWLIRQAVDLTKLRNGLPVHVDTLSTLGDRQAHTWRVDVFDDGVPATLTGYRATGYFLRNDDSTVSVSGTISGNTVSITLAQECYAVEGRLHGLIKMVNSSTNTTYTLAAFEFYVSKAISETIINPGSPIQNVTDLIAKIDEMNEAIEAVHAIETDYADTVLKNSEDIMDLNDGLDRKLDTQVFNDIMERENVTTPVTSFSNNCYVAVNGTVATIVASTNTGNRTAIIPIDPYKNYRIEAANAVRFRLAFSDTMFSGSNITDTKLVYSGNDATAPRTYNYSFISDNHKYLYVYLSNTGANVTLTVTKTLYASKTAEIALEKAIGMEEALAEKLDASVFNDAFAQTGTISNVSYRNDCYVAVSGADATIVKLSSGLGRTAIIPAFPGASYHVTAQGANRFRIAFADAVYDGKSITDCDLVYNGSDSTNPRNYERTFTNSGERKYLYIFLSNSGLMPILNVEYAVIESGIAIDNSGKIEELDSRLTVNENRDMSILRRAYVPFVPFHYSGDVDYLENVARKRGDTNTLETMYGLFDELKAAYPKNMFSSDLPYNGRILDAIPTSSTPGEDYEIVLVNTDTPGEYKQFIKLPSGWTRTHSWTDTSDGRHMDEVPTSKTAGTVGETVLVATEIDRVYTKYKLVSAGNWVEDGTYTDTNGSHEIDTIKMSCKTRVYKIVPFKDCKYEAYVLINGIHAMEAGSDMGTYYATKAMLEAIGTDTELGALMATHVVYVIPVANPSQMLRMNDDPTKPDYKKYTDPYHGFSENMVNMNRDFPTRWERYTSEYDRTGNIPLYDPYSRMLNDWLASLTGVRYCISKHDSGAYGDRSDLGYIRDVYKVGYDITQMIIRQASESSRATNQWIFDSFREDAGKDWTPDDRAMLRVTGEAAMTYGGVFDAHASQVLGVHTVLFESAPNTNTAVFTGGMHRTEMVRIIAEHIIDLLLGVNKNIANMEADTERLNTYYVWPEVE